LERTKKKINMRKSREKAVLDRGINWHFRKMYWGNVMDKNKFY